MAVVISNNMVLGSSTSQDQGNAGVIAYQSILNVNNVTASSALPTNPITNVANPATAWTWESAIADYAGSITYPDVTNLMPSPFDPSGWYGNTSEGTDTIEKITTPNPSGEDFIGLATQVGTDQFIMATNRYSSPMPVTIGEKAYACIIVKAIGTVPLRIRFRIADGQGFLQSTYYNVITNELDNSGVVTPLSNGYFLVQTEFTVTRDDSSLFTEVFMWNEEGGTNAPIGSQLYVQAAFFGKADDWPALVDTSGVKINIDASSQQVDYIGIARHNLNQAGLTVTVKYDGITVVPETEIGEVQALLFLQNLAAPENVEIIIKGASIPPQIGVIRIGKSLRLERNIYVGHTPITYGRSRKTVNGVSENGQYIGEIVVRQSNVTSVSLQNLTASWYRSMLDPFFAQTPRQPCFWAWRPETYPDEVGYAWIEGEPQMSNQRSNGMVEANWNFRAIA